MSLKHAVIAHPSDKLTGLEIEIPLNRFQNQSYKHEPATEMAGF
jgi:hypothetical protein